MNSTKLLVLQRVLPHYRTGIFMRLKERFPGLTVAYGDPRKNEPLKNDSSRLPDFFRKLRNIYPAGSPNIFASDCSRLIIKLRPEVVVSVFNTGNLNLYKMLILRKMLGFRLILWSFGYDPARGFDPANSFSDKIRLWLTNSADAVIFYWDKGKKVVENITGSLPHFFVAPNTLDTSGLEALRMEFDGIGRNMIKRELGVREDHHFVYVGRLICDKQVDHLVRAFGSLNKRIGNCRLTIIGDGPERNKLERASEAAGGNVIFAGEITDDRDVGKWLYISNALVMPGRLGLSVVHSFCFGTPVISQKKDSYFHGEGIGYLKDGINGMLAEDGNAEDLELKMERLITEPEVNDEMRRNALLTVANECSVQKFVEGFESAVNYAMERK